MAVKKKPIAGFGTPDNPIDIGGYIPGYVPGSAGFGTSPSGGTPPPVQPSQPSQPAQLPEDTMANRLANAGVAPKQPGMGARLSQDLLRSYAGQRELQAAQEQAAGIRQEVSNLPDITGAPQNVPNLNLETNPLEVAGAFGAGIGGATAGAGVGAGIGTAIMPGIGTAIGGVAGAAIGFTAAFVIKLSGSERQNVKEANKVYINGKESMQKIIYNLNHGFTTRQQAFEDYQAAKIEVYAARNNLKKKTQETLSEFLGDPGDELIEVETFIDLMPGLDAELYAAATSPNSLYVSPYQTQEAV